MQKYKKVFGITFIVIVSVATVIFVNSNKDIGNKEQNKSENKAENAGMGQDRFQAEESVQEVRIPELKEGVNVHELENEIFEVLGPENVAITTNRSSGSGILWQYDGEEIVVITTKHLLDKAEDGELDLWTGENVSFSEKNVYISEKEDLAAVKVSCDKKLKLKKGGISNYLAEKTPEIGSLIWIIDSVYGAASGIGTCSVASEEIFLEDYGTEMLLLYGEGKSGMSGSPIYDEGGNLVAMVSGMLEDGTTLAAVSARKIVGFLEDFSHD